MNIKENTKVMIFRFDGQYGASYSIGLSKKKQDGTYENGYMPCKFKKDVELENKSEIYIKSAWLTFNIKDKKTYPYIFINEFVINDNKEESTGSIKIEDLEIDDSSLPF